MREKSSPDSPQVKNVRRVFAFLAIFLVMIGQIFVYTSRIPDNVVMPVYVWIDIAGVVVFIWSQWYQPSPRVQALAARLRLSWPIAWIGATLLFSLITVLSMVLFVNYGRTNYIPVLTFWFFSAICYLAGFFKSAPSLAGWGEWLKQHRNELIGLGAICLVGVALRFYKLGEIPRVVNGDEGRLGIAALSTKAYPYANPFALWENFGALYLQAVSLSMQFFGVSPFSLRLMAAIGGILAIPAVYLLARQISGVRVALIAASLLAFSHTQIHFSRTVAVAYIQGTWLIPLELYFLLSGLTRRSSWRAALGGILLAIHFIIYLDSQIILTMILVYMLLAYFFLRSWFRPALRQAFVFLGGFLIISLPEITYIFWHPDIFFSRLNSSGTFQSGWLVDTIANTGQAAVLILGERVIHAFLSVIYYPSFDFYGSPVPMLSPISAVLFLLGLGIMLWKTRSPGYLLMNGYFWAGTLAIGIFSIPPSADTYRMLMVLPAAFIMAAVGLDLALEVVGLGWTQARPIYAALVTVTILSLLIFNVWAYYYEFAGRCLYGTDDPPTRFASYLGNFARTVDRDNEIYLLSDAVYFYGSHPSVDFLDQNRSIVNVNGSADTLQAKPHETIIATINRIAELRTWADAHPGGKLHYEMDCQQTILLAYQFP
jgi:hypothetical protein